MSCCLIHPFPPGCTKTSPREHVWTVLLQASVEASPYLCTLWISLYIFVHPMDIIVYFCAPYGYHCIFLCTLWISLCIFVHPMDIIVYFLCTLWISLYIFCAPYGYHCIFFVHPMDIIVYFCAPYGYHCIFLCTLWISLYIFVHPMDIIVYRYNTCYCTGLTHFVHPSHVVITQHPPPLPNTHSGPTTVPPTTATIAATTSSDGTSGTSTSQTQGVAQVASNEKLTSVAVAIGVPLGVVVIALLCVIVALVAYIKRYGYLDHVHACGKCVCNGYTILYVRGNVMGVYVRMYVLRQGGILLSILCSFSRKKLLFNSPHIRN